MNKRGRRNLFIQWIFRIWNPQPAPHLRGLLINWQDRIRISPRDLIEPAFQELSLLPIPAMPNALNSLSQLTNCHHRQIKIEPLTTRAVEKRSHAKVGFLALANFTDHIGINEKHKSPTVALLTTKVTVLTYIWDRLEHCRQRPPPRSS